MTPAERRDLLELLAMYRQLHRDARMSGERARYAERIADIERQLEDT